MLPIMYAGTMPHDQICLQGSSLGSCIKGGSGVGLGASPIKRFRSSEIDSERYCIFFKKFLEESWSVCGGGGGGGGVGGPSPPKSL